MKKITQILVIAILSLGFSTAKASDKKVFGDANENYYPPVDYRNADPIMFIERGVEFYVFPNGDFDFNTVTTTAPRTSSREARNTTYGAPGVQTRSYNHYYPRNYGIRIEHDSFGRVRRIGNVFINYDFDGRVKRVGSVYMRYNSFALTQIGGMRIIYDRHGCIVNMVGYVNASSATYFNNYQNNNHYQADNYYNNNNNGADNYNDEEYYYYRKDGSKAKMSKDDIKEINEKN